MHYSVLFYWYLLCSRKANFIDSKDYVFCIQISIPVSLTELPASQKLYLTTPLDVAFDPDLSLQSSMAFLTFQSECEEAVSQPSCLLLLVRDVL